MSADVCGAALRFVMSVSAVLGAVGISVPRGVGLLCPSVQCWILLASLCRGVWVCYVRQCSVGYCWRLFAAGCGFVMFISAVLGAVSVSVPRDVGLLCPSVQCWVLLASLCRGVWVCYVRQCSVGCCWRLCAAGCGFVMSVSAVLGAVSVSVPRDVDLLCPSVQCWVLLASLCRGVWVCYVCQCSVGCCWRLCAAGCGFVMSVRAVLGAVSVSVPRDVGLLCPSMHCAVSVSVPRVWVCYVRQCSVGCC